MVAVVTTSVFLWDDVVIDVVIDVGIDVGIDDVIDVVTNVLEAVRCKVYDAGLLKS
jgi:hypothetical protein